MLCAGAPVPAALWEEAPRFLTGGRLHSPYGATEVLPVSSATADDIDPASVRGACVGRPLAENRVKIIAITEGPIATLADARELPAGDIGEIIVTGPTVTREYDRRPDATALAKIPETGDRRPETGGQPSLAASGSFGNWHLAIGTSTPATGAVWHRMGDAGFLDAQGRLWFCGRIAERVVTPQGVLYTEPCEQVFRQSPAGRAVRPHRRWAGRKPGTRPCGRTPGAGRTAGPSQRNCASWPGPIRTPPASADSISGAGSRSMCATTPRSTDSRLRGGRPRAKPVEVTSIK